MSRDLMRQPSHVLQLMAFGLMLMLAACGNSGAGAGAGSSGGGRNSDGPDVAAAQTKLLASVNSSAEGNARFAEFKETGRKQEGEGDFQGCVVEFAGVLEFTGDCEYNGKVRKAGERQNFEAQVEFIKDKEGWKQLTMGLYPL